mmetsp:Transcript_28165/g.81426  ORF Transcript_28165/g.81426 Transcript_28165/m.81426 type:complete len:295 (+) Transcript_28165:80-964(+)
MPLIPLFGACKRKLIILVLIAAASATAALSAMPSYTRPGVAAAARLAALKGPSRKSIWEKIEAKYDEAMMEKGGVKLVKLDRFCQKLSSKIVSVDEPSITREELLKVVDWKFAKGKPRYALLNRLKSNQNVDECSREAFAESKEGNRREAIDALCALNGVGPATASAILSLHRGDIFAFMDDEVVEALYEGKRGYTFKIYNEMNSRCAELAQELGDEWSTRRVGRALWTAARLCASGEEDLTVASSKEEDVDDKKVVAKTSARKKAEGKARAATDDNEDTPASKRRGLRQRKGN